MSWASAGSGLMSGTVTSTAANTSAALSAAASLLGCGGRGWPAVRCVGCGRRCAWASVSAIPSCCCDAGSWRSWSASAGCGSKKSLVLLGFGRPRRRVSHRAAVHRLGVVPRVARVPPSGCCGCWRGQSVAASIGLGTAVAAILAGQRDASSSVSAERSVWSSGGLAGAPHRCILWLWQEPESNIGSTGSGGGYG